MIERLKEIVKAHLVYKDYLYDSEDVRPLNKLLEINGFKPLGQIKVQLKDELDKNYEGCEGQTYTILDFSRFGDDVIFFVEEVDGEFDFTQIEKIF